MDDAEIRLRLIEAAARLNPPHQDGPGAAAVTLAQQWWEWVRPTAQVPTAGKTLGLPKK